MVSKLEEISIQISYNDWYIALQYVSVMCHFDQLLYDLHLSQLLPRA